MVEGARLEIVYAATYRGFESHPLRHFPMVLSESEIDRRDQVVALLRDYTIRNQTIRLPEYDAKLGHPGSESALLWMGREPNEFQGSVGEFQYQFEGEDDLLHLMITRRGLGPVSMEEAQRVVSALLPDIPISLIWMKVGTNSQHFYFGHDLLVESP